MKHEIINTNEISMDFQLEAKDANGSATMFEFTVPAGAKVPVTYYHEHFEETIYGLERIITFTVEGKAIDIMPGETHFIPREAICGSDN